MVIGCRLIHEQSDLNISGLNETEEIWESGQIRAESVTARMTEDKMTGRDVKTGTKPTGVTALRGRQVGVRGPDDHMQVDLGGTATVFMVY